jgi:starch synthase (maltosyl-transferring)
MPQDIGMEREDSCRRVVIENVSPQVDSGRYPAKSIVGNVVMVEADIYADGHDALSARLTYRHEKAAGWTELPMHHFDNDRWQGSFTATISGLYYFNITAWVDPFLSWCQDLKKRVAAEQKDIAVYLAVGTQMISDAALRAVGADRQKFGELTGILRSPGTAEKKKIDLALGDEIRDLMTKYDDRPHAGTNPYELTVAVDVEKAGFSTWYEMFPRSTSSNPNQHGTFKDCETRLPYIAAMGFDVLYFPPIHPIGLTNRKGKNNSVNCQPGDPGTPWAIGSEEGGHKAVNPLLGTLDDFRHLLAAAKDFRIDIALDIAFHCSPDHPYVKEHPEWFLHRPDGSLQYAENPPKKYQDIYPFNFETPDWQALWQELKSIVIFWAEQGVRIFRVDNPHTKPFRFWEWLLAEVKKEYPDAIFLAEAFTRPKVMYHLAKLGFTQSYTYFTWRNTKKEMTDYLIELTQTPVKDFFRPNFWTNTPDILHEYLQKGGRPAFIVRLVLAATLSPNYGIYGPAFELMVNTPREPGSEEYLNSGKYEIKLWDIDRPDNIKRVVTRVNGIRLDNPALHRNDNLWFNTTSNDQLICYSKHTDDRSNIILTVVNFDPRNTQSGTVNTPLSAWGFSTEHPYRVYDLLSDRQYTWRGEWNYVELNPAVCSAHIFRLDGLIPLPTPEVDVSVPAPDSKLD